MLQKDKTMIGVRKCVSECGSEWEKLEEESGREWGWKERIEWLDEFIGRLDYEAIRSGDL